MRVTTVGSLAAVCLLGGAVEGHVRVLNRDYAVRNANSDDSDGVNSVSGPCGGNNVWGNDVNSPRFTAAVDEDTFCTTIQYNGGHKSPNNVFRATFMCGAPGNENLFNELESLPLVAGTSPPSSDGFLVPAPRGNEQAGGYTLCIDLPPQNLNEDVPADSDLRKCTISVMDQREWGGCVDLILSDVPQIPTPPPTPSPTASLTSRLEASEGTYAITDCDQNAGGECCLEGFLGISMEGQVSIRAHSVPHAGLSEIEAECPEGEVVAFSQLEDASETFAAGTLASPTIPLMFEGGQQSEDFQLIVQDPGQSIVVLNVGQDLPKNSDTTAVFSATLEEGLENGDVPTQSGGGSSSSSSDDSGKIIGAVIGCLVAVGLALFSVKQYNNRTSSGTSGRVPSVDMPSLRKSKEVRGSKNARSSWMTGGSASAVGGDGNGRAASSAVVKKEWMKGKLTDPESLV